MGPLIENATRQDGSLNSRGFSLQLLVLRFGLLQDGDVGIRVVPQGDQNSSLRQANAVQQVGEAGVGT
jgi:hypothetical protein